MTGINVNSFLVSERMTARLFWRDGLSKRTSPDYHTFTPINPNCDTRTTRTAGRGGRVEQGGSLGIHTKSHAIPYLQGFGGGGRVVRHAVNLRLERFKLQEKAKSILNKTVQRGKNKWAYVHRVNYCLHSRVDTQKGVGLMYNTQRQKANFGNLQRCGSVWCCPVCSAQISEGRRHELRQGIDNWTSKGGHVYLVTFTNRHHYGDDLADLLAGQKKAFVKFWQKRAVTEMLKKLGYVGRIVATEVTHSQANGWHPHYHMLFFFEHGVNMQALQSFLALHWQDVCVKAGLKAPTLANGVDVRDGTFASEYASKWGLDHEMTKGHTKKGKIGGLTPFDLLRASTEKNDCYAKLFRQFADVFKGRRQLVWSDGLKELLGIEQKSDDEIIQETERKSELIRELSWEIWQLILAYRGRAIILDLSELDYLDNGTRVDNFIMSLAKRFIDDIG